MFVLKVNKSAIRVLESEAIYGDSKNIYNVVLLFNDDWNGLTKVITFDNEKKSIPIIADATRTIITTSIPWELLTYPGSIRVSVSGARNNLVVLPTQFCNLGKIHKGNTVEYPPEVGDPPPSPSFADQMMALIAQKGDTVEFIDGMLYLKSDGKVISQTEIQNGSDEPRPGGDGIVSGLNKEIISDKSFFGDDPVNKTYALKDVIIEYIDDEGLPASMIFEDDVVQVVSEDDSLTFYKIDGKVIKFLYSNDGALTLGSVGYPSTGSDGASAYEIAVKQGFEGTEQEWIDSLKGAKGNDGKSAYELALEDGFKGTLSEWLESLHGTDGLTAYDIAVNNGYKGTEEEWLKSLAGASAYEIAVSNGFEGTEEDYLNSLKGKSAYELALDEGFEGSLEDYLKSLRGKPGAKGNKGDAGKSAYEIAVDNGFEGTEEEWLESIGGSNDHALLINRDASAQHPISAIEGLEAKLETIPVAIEPFTNLELEEILK